ncbi:putative uncharacterized protein [Prevotella sp. CAG:873]|nr:putative uncharacterized protein [Prevotella sp. CAG:873]
MDKQYPEGLVEALTTLRDYCARNDYKGWDPYDGLNSRVFRAISLIGRSAIIRLCWIQLFKRSPLNLRPLLLVPKQHNAKGVALAVQAHCEMFHAVEADPPLAEVLGTQDTLKAEISRLSQLLVSLATPGFSGPAWGYNFPWQCRREFLFPAGQPTVVATNFAVWALLDAYDITGDETLKDTACAAARFVTEDLRRTPHAGGVILSYSAMPGNDTIYNASLLGSRLLTRIYTYTKDDSLLDLARQSLKACAAEQRPDGSWTYGLKPVTGWIDSFHTGYDLDAYADYARLTNDHTYDEVLRHGLEYYTTTFFDASDGTPSYYHDKRYPIDIHCPGQLPVTLDTTNSYDRYRPLALKVLRWTLDNMRQNNGTFMYQKKPGISSRIPYMRWSLAFELRSLAVTLRREAQRRAEAKD